MWDQLKIQGKIYVGLNNFKLYVILNRIGLRVKNVLICLLKQKCVKIRLVMFFGFQLVSLF